MNSDVAIGMDTMPASEWWTIRMNPTHGHVSVRHLRIVFKGPVDWTEKMTESGPNPTECNRTVGCGCPLSRAVGLPVASILE
jgi:hypothetical protein